MIPLYQNLSTFQSGLQQGSHYLWASNGLFLVQETPLFSATTRVPDRQELQPATAALQLRIPRLPRRVIEEVYGFFLEVYSRHQCEAFAFLLYTPDSASWSVAVPAQRLSRYANGVDYAIAIGVHYETIARPPGTVILGDIHSHGRHRAYFSATDTHDDLTHEGLHVVLGCLDHAEPDCCASFVTNRTRFNLNPSDVIESFTEAVPPPETWFSQITVDTTPALPWPSMTEKGMKGTNKPWPPD